MLPTLGLPWFATAVRLAVPLSASKDESVATTLIHLRGFFPTDLDDIASRLNAAPRLTIVSHCASSDAKKSPTTAPTTTKRHQPTHI
jgi:hypothetical protein